LKWFIKKTQQNPKMQSMVPHDFRAD